MATLLCKWRFDESSGTTAADDISGADGTLTVVSSYPAWVTGRQGNCLEFNGADYANTGTPRVITTDTPQDVGCMLYEAHSHVVWARSPSGAAVPKGIYAVRDPLTDSLTNPSWENIFIDASGYVKFGMLFAIDATAYYERASCGVDDRDDTWHMYTATWTPGGTGIYGTMRVYRDKTLKEERGVNSLYYLGSTSSGGKFQFGMDRLVTWVPVGYGGTFDGFIDECRFYCGALTLAEIEDLYDGNPVKNAMMFSCNT